VKLGSGLPRSEKFFLPLIDEGLVFAVRGNDDTQLVCELECLIQLAIIDAERTLVRQEDLERADALLDDLSELLLRGIVESGHAHVKRKVAGADALGLSEPGLERLHGVVGLAGADHLDERGRAAEKCGTGGGFPSVLGVCAHEGQVDVDMRVDETGEDVLTRGIDDVCAGGARVRIDVLLDAGDGVCGAVDVGDVIVGRGNDAAVLDQYWHARFSSSPPACSTVPQTSRRSTACPS